MLTTPPLVMLSNLYVALQQIPKAPANPVKGRGHKRVMPLFASLLLLHEGKGIRAINEGSRKNYRERFSFPDLSTSHELMQLINDGANESILDYAQDLSDIYFDGDLGRFVSDIVDVFGYGHHVGTSSVPVFNGFTNAVVMSPELFKVLLKTGWLKYSANH